MGLILREAKADILWFLRTGLCGILVHVEDGEIVKVGGDPSSPFHPFRGGKLCPKGMSAVEWHYHPDRLNFPLKRVRGRGEGEMATHYVGSSIRRNLRN